MRSAAAKLLQFLGWTYAVYLLVSLLIVLPALNVGAPWAVREFLDRELQHELILFNPFTVALEVRGASIHEADGHVPLALRKAKVDVSMASLWREGIVLDAIRIEELDVHVLRYEDGSFHFDDMLPTEETPDEANSETPGITIETLYLGAHTLRFTDRTRPGPYSAAYRDFAIETSDITTLPNGGGEGELDVRGADGGTLRWQGGLAIAEGYSSGKISLDKLDLTHLWRHQSERLAFVAESAMLDVSLDYTVNWSDELRFTISDGLVQIHELTLIPKDTILLPNTDARITELTFSDIDLDSVTQTVALHEISVSGILLRGFADTDRSSLVEMFTVTGLESLNAEDEQEPSGEEQQSWGVSVDEIRVDDSRVDWGSENFTPEFMSIAPLEVTASNIQWPATQDSRFDVAFTINDQSSIDTGGTLNLDNGNGEINYSLETLPLAWFNPMLTRFVRADVNDGLLSLNGTVSLTDFAPRNATTDISLRNFAMQISGDENSALAFEELTVQQANVDIANSVASIEDINLVGLRSATNILENGDFNISTALIAQDDAEDQADEVDESNEEESAPWAVRITHIGVRNGQVNFSDASLPLPFETLIGDIEADINDLDSMSEQPLVATLNGAVDGYAPVVIEARGRPLADPRDTSVTLRFRGMDIASMSPYSGTYAGYTIDSGTLSIDLGYAVQGTQLAGENRIVISQMELGEAIESDRAMQLPLTLGLALLTDAEGVIDLDIPISGDVDDPQFSLGRVIGGAIVNIIVKAATAPFRLLAGLVDSEEDLENIAFTAGAATLSETGTSSLAALAQALEKRPKLQLRIVGSTEPVVDRRALQALALNDGLLEDGLPPEALEGETGAYLTAIDARYGALELPAPLDDSPISLELKLEALRSRIELPPGTLQDLGTDRAIEAKRELVTIGGIDAARIAVSYDKSLLITGAKMSVDG